MRTLCEQETDSEIEHDPKAGESLDPGSPDPDE
jgi:hypothetical protein